MNVFPHFQQNVGVSRCRFCRACVWVEILAAVVVAMSVLVSHSESLGVRSLSRIAYVRLAMSLAVNPSATYLASERTILKNARTSPPFTLASAAYAYPAVGARTFLGGKRILWRIRCTSTRRTTCRSSFFS